MIRLFILCAATASLTLTSCSSTDEEHAARKPRPRLPGDEIDEKSWNRPTRSEDFSSPMGGMPMSR
jgi:hypothetical protein